MIKRCPILVSLLVACSILQAQEQKDRVQGYVPSSADWSQGHVGMSPVSHADVNACNPNTLLADTMLALPLMKNRDGWYAGTYPVGGYGGWSDWSLHDGLNMSLSASATVGLGRHSLSGFSQSVAMMYALPLSPRMSLAVGGYYSHFNLGNVDFNDVGINAVLGYKLDDHWEAYLYAQKSVMTPRVPRPLYDFTSIGDKIGAEVRYNISPSTSIGVSVWYQDIPSNYGPPRYHDGRP